MDLASAQPLQAHDFPAFEEISGPADAGLVLICDHARADVPRQYDQLGLPPSQFERHIAYDIGARALTLQLAERLKVPAVLSTFSRLLIDPNRGEDDPTLIMKISDGALVPGNVTVDADERRRRLDAYYRPYHAAVENMITRSINSGNPPLVFSIHSFTPFWKGVARPWHVGILWNEDDRFARPLIDGLASQAGLVVGENKPYSGGVEGESVDRHARQRSLAAALLEVRQDLIETQSGVDEWAGRLVEIIDTIRIAPSS